MKRNTPLLLSLAIAALLTGCATQSELIRKRISQKADFFATLSPASQQRLSDGQLVSGDTRDAAWIIYGKPDRVFEKVTGTSTNEVWSYVTQGFGNDNESRPVYPVRATGIGSIGQRDTLWATDRRYNSPYEYRRIEFQDGRVLHLEP